MGHAYWNILNDSIARYKRMRGYNVLLPQGWDCQGLPTELKVQDRWLISKDDKELFREKCVEWTKLMIDSMKKTMTRLGYRPDWEQFEYRTMDPDYWRIVQTTLLTFFEQDLIYRSGYDMIKSVRSGKYLKIQIESTSSKNAKEQVFNMCNELRIFNPVVHTCTINVKED